MSRAGRQMRGLLEGAANIPQNFTGFLEAYLEGRARLPFTFDRIRVINGTQPHTPHTDLEEVRPSLTIQFLGGRQIITAHIFHDGTIKTREQMHMENNRREDEKRRLSAEEARLPQLGHTRLRLEAHQLMMARIRALRDDTSLSIMAKQVQRDNARLEYNRTLRELAEKRQQVWEAIAEAQRRNSQSSRR